ISLSPKRLREIFYLDRLNKERANTNGLEKPLLLLLSSFAASFFSFSSFVVSAKEEEKRRVASVTSSVISNKGFNARIFSFKSATVLLLSWRIFPVSSKTSSNLSGNSSTVFPTPLITFVSPYKLYER